MSAASKWTTLTAEVAATHPMYGIRGAASLLRAVCAVIPALGLLESIGTLTRFAETPRGILPIDGVLIVPYIVFFLWSGYNAILLDKKKPSFIPSFLTFLVLGPVLSVCTPFLWQRLSGVTPVSGTLSSSALSVLVAWGLWALIWAPYVAYSTRLNVTLLHRVRRPSKPVVMVTPTQQPTRAMPTAATPLASGLPLTPPQVDRSDEGSGPGSDGKRNLRIPDELKFLFDKKESQQFTVRTYRDWAHDRKIALTEKTSDELILKVYNLVVKYFIPRIVNGIREKEVSINTTGFIILQMLIVNEKFGAAFMIDHLKYQIDYYRDNGLRPEYAEGVPFPAGWDSTPNSNIPINVP